MSSSSSNDESKENRISDADVEAGFVGKDTDPEEEYSLSDPDAEAGSVNEVTDFALINESNYDRRKRWKQAALILNASRRFSKKEEEEKALTLRKIRNHAQVIRNAYRFQEAGTYSDQEPLLGPSETENSHHMDIEQGNNSEDHEAHRRRNNTGWSSQKVDLGWIFVIANVVLELPSAVFDQLSSVHKPRYALLSMLMSFAAIVICIVELVYKGRKEKVKWRWRSTLPWLYYPSHSHNKPFGDFKDIIGLVCALCQSIVTSIGYGFSRHHVDNPIRISIWPIIFAFGLLFSKFLEKPERVIS